MEVKAAKIFLCYARKDLGKVNQLYDQLKAAGFSPWQDVKDIHPGEVWHDMLMRAIREAPFFLACLSSNSVDKRGVIQEEIKEALTMWRQKLEDDIYFIPLRLEDCQVPASLAKFQWVDLFQGEGFNKLSKALRRGLDKLGLIAPLTLRSQPVEKLSEGAVKEMLKAQDFFDVNNNWMGRGVYHLYEPKEISGDMIIIDHTTGLMWQKSGSSRMNYEAVGDYIAELNNQEFAGFGDWRMPGLEEAMSLMEAKKSERDGLYINALFDKAQSRLWTADTNSVSVAWVILFDLGYCFRLRVDVDDGFVRAVRSG